MKVLFRSLEGEYVLPVPNKFFRDITKIILNLRNPRKRMRLSSWLVRTLTPPNRVRAISALLRGFNRGGGFARYSRDQSLAAIARSTAFLVVMAAGSILGTFIGGRLLGSMPSVIILPNLAAILKFSAYRVWHHV